MAIDRLRIPDGRDSITRLIYGHNELIARWVAIQLKQPLTTYTPGMYHAVGIIKNDAIIGGVIWHNYHEDYKGRPLLIEVTLATIDKQWCSRHNLCELFQYPFTQIGVGRVQATCHRKAKHVRSTLERLGFTFEGIVREAHPLGGDAAHYSLLKRECRWLNHGKKRTFAATGSRPGGNVSSTNRIESANGAL